MLLIKLILKKKKLRLLNNINNFKSLRLKSIVIEGEKDFEIFFND